MRTIIMCATKIDDTLGNTKTPYTLLLIDDQEIVAEALRKVLSAETDIEVHYCADSLQSIKMARQLKPSVILLDLIMPDVDGITILKYLRASPDISQIPIIVLSGKEDGESKAEALENGANDYLVKWPPVETLVARIRNYL